MNIKLCHPDAIKPTYATANSAGMDLYLLKDLWVTDRPKLALTGVAVAIPTGCVGMLYVRASIALAGVFLANGAGVVDADYRGALTVPLVLNVVAATHVLRAGERIAQLVIQPVAQVALDVVKDLD